MKVFLMVTCHVVHFPSGLFPFVLLLPFLTAYEDKINKVNDKIINWIKQWHIHKVSLRLLFPVQLEFGVLVFVEAGKSENPQKNPRSKEENQQQTQTTCDARSGNRTPNPGHSGERRALSPLRHPFSPKEIGTGRNGQLLEPCMELLFPCVSLLCSCLRCRTLLLLLFCFVFVFCFFFHVAYHSCCFSIGFCSKHQHIQRR